jgi:hypothetical protein
MVSAAPYLAWQLLMQRKAMGVGCMAFFIGSNAGS